MGRSSRIPGFHRLSVAERIRALREAGVLSDDDAHALAGASAMLSVDRADRTIENVVGVFALPLGLGLNLVVNGRDYVVPMVVEEPSIVAGLSGAARTARAAGGFSAESGEALLIGQIQVLGLDDVPAARAELLGRRQEIIDLADSLHPRMAARGGGVRDVEVHVHPIRGGGAMLVLHLLVDTRDAMGANLVNTICEGVAPLVEAITGGEVCLRILSNLADRALVRARVRLAPADCGGDGERVCDGIVAASDLAAVDRYRAATHNPGIMNGIDAVALATGNDWRALEAGAHAHAAAGGHYRGLSRWWRDADGFLVGELELPLKVGIVGGNLQSNPAVALNQRLLGVESAAELSEVMAAVGLAQNFSALRALVTQGIQHGHMTLHARSVATAAGASPAVFDEVVDRLVESGEIKLWKARAILDSMAAGARGEAATGEVRGVGHGKIILLGEHAAVYGRHVLAAPVPLAVEAHVEDASAGVELIIPRWGVERRLPADPAQRHSFEQPIGLILEHLGLAGRPMRIQVFPHVPRLFRRARGQRDPRPRPALSARARRRGGQRAGARVREGGARQPLGGRQPRRHLQSPDPVPARGTSNLENDLSSRALAAGRGHHRGGESHGPHRRPCSGGARPRPGTVRAHLRRDRCTDAGGHGGDGAARSATTGRIHEFLSRSAERAGGILARARGTGGARARQRRPRREAHRWWRRRFDDRAVRGRHRCCRRGDSDGRLRGDGDRNWLMRTPAGTRWFPATVTS